MLVILFLLPVFFTLQLKVQGLHINPNKWPKNLGQVGIMKMKACATFRILQC